MSYLVITPAGTVMVYGDGTVMRLMDAEVFTIPSRSSENLIHKVTHWEGKWDCSCIWYRNHKHCYHIDEVRKAVEE